MGRASRCARRGRAEEWERRITLRYLSPGETESMFGGMQLLPKHVLTTLRHGRHCSCCVAQSREVRLPHGPEPHWLQNNRDKSDARESRAIGEPGQKTFRHLSQDSQGAFARARHTYVPAGPFHEPPRRSGGARVHRTDTFGRATGSLRRNENRESVFHPRNQAALIRWARRSKARPPPP